MRAALALALILCCPPLAFAAPPDSPQAALQESELSYKKQRYKDVETVVKSLLYPTIELANEDSVVEAHRLLALSYFFQKKLPEARQEVVALLALRPTFELDPIVEPPVAVSFFQTIRKEQEDRLQAIRRRQLEDAARAQKEEERRRAAEKARAERVYIERTIEHHSRWLAMVPFGVGQIQNGQRGKAIFFAVTEAAMGALSLSTWLATELTFPIERDPNTGQLNRVYQPAQAQLAQTLLGLQLGSGAAFWGLVAWGIIDAQVKFVPEIVKTRELPHGVQGLTLRPILSPGLMGLGLSGAF